MPKIRTKEIDVDVFLRLCASHSRLSHAEYNRNPAYNSDHFSHIVEVDVIKEIDRLNLGDELMELMEA